MVRRLWYQSLRRGGGRSGSWDIGGGRRLPHGGDFIVVSGSGRGGGEDRIRLLARNGARSTARQISEKELNLSVRRQPVRWLGTALCRQPVRCPLSAGSELRSLDGHYR